LYGVVKQEGSDPLQWLRVVLASNKGTVMELGMSPIITAGMIMQFLLGANKIDVNMRSKEDRELYQSALKVFAIFITFVQALAYCLAGMYGPIAQLGLVNCALIVAQLTLGGFVVIMLDELLSKGYGVGSGINMFIATSICKMILWKCFSPI
jgi:protein transport protein SEC61 subunit alpha